MKARLRIACALLILPPLPGAAAALAPPPPGAEAAETLKIPFAPPLGQKLHYRLTGSEPDADPAKPKPSIGMTVEFARTGEHYVMAVAFEVPGAADVASEPLAVLLTTPMRYRVDGDGVIVGFEDEDAYWAGFETTMTSLERQPGRPDSAAIRGGIASIRALPLEERLSRMSKRIAPLIAMSASEFPLGIELELEEGAEPGETASILAARSGSNRATISLVNTASAEALQATAAARGGNSSEEGPVAAETREEYEVSLVTGVTERYRKTITVETETGGRRTKEAFAETTERLR